MLMHVSRAPVGGLRQAGAGRLIVVGRASSLRQSGGARHLDNLRFPAEYQPLALAHAQTRDYFLTVVGLDWIHASPLSSSSPANGPACSGSSAASC